MRVQYHYPQTIIEIIIAGCRSVWFEERPEKPGEING
jgi:hypothetical protein